MTNEPSKPTLVDYIGGYTLADLFSPFYYFGKGVLQGLEDSKAKAVQTVKIAEQEYQQKRLAGLQYASAFQDYYSKFLSNTQIASDRPKIEKSKPKRRLPKITHLESYKVYGD